MNALSIEAIGAGTRDELPLERSGRRGDDVLAGVARYVNVSSGIDGRSRGTRKWGMQKLLESGRAGESLDYIGLDISLLTIAAS